MSCKILRFALDARNLSGNRVEREKGEKINSCSGERNSYKVECKLYSTVAVNLNLIKIAFKTGRE